MRTKLFVLSIILILALSACGPATAGTTNTLVITGTGTVYVTPDIAYVYVGVHTEESDIDQAVTGNNEIAQAVVNALRASGVEASDIQTSNFNIWSYQKTDPMTGMDAGLVYSVDNTVYVKVRDLSKLSEVLDAAIQAGANNINSVSFDVADKTASLAEARAQAMENATAIANELAGNAGMSVGTIQNITFTDMNTYYYGYGMGGGGAASESALAPINPGQLEVTATVNITYGLK